jgi:competence protein ComEC
MTGIFVCLLSFSILSNDSIEINSADLQMLQTIPAIGTSGAESIIEYREAFGPFWNISELDFVAGIGTGTVESISEYAYVDTSMLPDIDRSHWLSQVDSLVPLLQIYFLDVGQGDAALIRAADGLTMLFDGGPDPGGPLEPIVFHRLECLEIDTIDIVAFSHPHADHIGGLTSVLRNFTVREVMDPGMVFSSPVYEALLEEIQNQDCGYSILSDGMVINLSDHVTAEVQTPFSPGQDVSVNEASALIRISCGDFSVLLTGDVEEEGEMVLAPAVLPVTVLKVPHHGSSSSVFPPYLRGLAPQMAVFSAGRRNRFGHPNPAVIDFYREMGCEILRTDTQGTIVVQSDGRVFSTGTIFYGYRPGDDIEE